MSAEQRERPLLAIMLLSAEAEKLRSALILARCEIALGGAARLFIQGPATTLVIPPISAADDEACAAAGEPRLGQLLDEALADGLSVMLCETGLTIARSDQSRIDPRIEISGPIAFLAGIDKEMRLLTI